MEIKFKAVGCVALKDGKGNYTVVVPIYVNLDDVDRQAIEESEQKVLERASALITRTFERQIKDFIEKQKKEAQNARA